MKILFVFFLPSGGVETLNRQRCAALTLEGMSCHILYLRPGAGLQNQNLAHVHMINEDHEIKQLLDQEQFDVIVVTSDFLMLERLRKLGYTKKLIFEGQGFGNHTQAVEALNLAAPYVKAFANAVLYPPTPHLTQLFQDIYPEMVHFSFTNCFDTGAFHYQAVATPAYPILAWVGRIEANKNWLAFLEIGQRLIQQLPTLRMWLFEDSNLGEFLEKDKFAQAIVSLGIQPHLDIFSNVPHAQMASYYSMIGDSGGLLCSTSRLEGFGYAVLEAMSCRCPVLASDSDGVKFFLIHDFTGKFYLPDNVNDAVAHAQDLLYPAAKRESIRNHAQEHVRNQFSLSLYAQHFKAMLNQLMASG
ncbi:MAG: glycosyltransferase family 4 protein [Gorillibacterium sp.]|nr:glycosyltransferase family 4 protein [Gorillibacterium sp.]